MQRQAFVTQSLRIDLHLELTLALTPDRHVCDARDTHETRLHRPAREHRHVDEGQFVRRQADVHDAARRRHGLQHGGCLGNVRQSVGLCETLLHHLTGAHEVGARLEDEHDGRQPRHGLGANGLQPGNAVEKVRFERYRDQLLHLGRGQSVRFGLDFHVGCIELREDVHWRVTQLRIANEHHRRGDGYHEEPVMQTVVYDPTHHCWRPPCVFALAPYPSVVHPAASVIAMMLSGSAWCDGTERSPSFLSKTTKRVGTAK